MLFTWDTSNLCIVFRWWHIRSTPGLFLSLLAVVALGAGYEALREGIRRYEVVLAKRADAVPRKLLPCFRFSLLTFPPIFFLFLFPFYFFWLCLFLSSPVKLLFAARANS